MKHILNNTNQGEVAPWVVLNEDGVHYGGNVVIEEDPDYVDLGLPSGLLWAKCNVGATTETEAGLYFMWGDTVGRTADEVASKPCSWATAPFNNGSSNCDVTYFISIKDTVCPNNILALQYDAAYQATNGKAHMPTTNDIVELVNNTTNEWVTDYKGSGVDGRLFTSNTNGNTLFIPAAGDCGGSSLYLVGSVGYVWSSSFDSSTPDGAYELAFDSSDINPQNSHDHCNGNTVRAVKNPS